VAPGLGRRLHRGCDAGECYLRDDEIALPFGVGGIRGCQLVDDVPRSDEEGASGVEVSGADLDITELLVGDGEIALLLGVAGVYGSQLFGDVQGVPKKGASGIEVPASNSTLPNLW
jgi:hypothetical protein